MTFKAFKQIDTQKFEAFLLLVSLKTEELLYKRGHSLPSLCPATKSSII